MFKHLVFFLIISNMVSLNADSLGIDRLMKGNKRFVLDNLEHSYRSIERREAVVSSQNPFAVVVACSDSRASPEIIFDQGLGDLFVVRVAGNVIGPLELESIKYSVIYLHSTVILVLGHENCGAVDAVIQGTTEDIKSIAKIINPSVERAKAEGSKRLLEIATKANALKMRDDLLAKPVIRNLVAGGKLEVYAGYYHLNTGVVELLK